MNSERKIEELTNKGSKTIRRCIKNVNLRKSMKNFLLSLTAANLKAILEILTG